MASANKKIKMRLFIGLAVLVTAVILALTGLSARSWNPALSHDTCVYYYHEVQKLNPPGTQNIITSPFKVPSGTTEPDAAQAKPVFIALLNLWHTGYKWLDSSLIFPDHQVYSDFIFASFVLAFLSFVWLVWFLGYPLLLGLLSSLIAFVNVWALTVVYFNSYTAISLFLLGTAFGLIYTRTAGGLVAAGALMAADVLINQSVTVFLVSFAGLTLFLPNTFRQRLCSLIYYMCGIALAWAGFEAIVLAENIINHWLYMPQYKVLSSYLNLFLQHTHLQQSVAEPSNSFGAFSSSVFPLMVWKFSHVYSAVFVASLASAILAMRKKWRAFFDRPEAALLFVLLLTLILVDWRTGPKFSRTYFLLLPFAVMFTTISCYGLWEKTEKARRWGGVIILLLLSLYLLECVKNLQDQKTSFLAVKNKILTYFHDKTPAYFFGNDTYAPYFLQLVEGKNAEQSSTMRASFIQDLCDPVIDSRLTTLRVMAGPNVPSVINLPGLFTGTVSLPLSPYIKQNRGLCRDKSWTAVLEESIPFFSHYPFLMLEDPRESNRLLKDRAVVWDDYKYGIGQVFLWKVTYVTLN